MIKPSVHRSLTLMLALIAFSLAFIKTARHHSSSPFMPPNVIIKSAQTPEINTYFVSSQQGIHVHAASLVELGDGRVRAFWFAGSKEGAEDVEIRSAVFDTIKKTWSTEQLIVNRLNTENSLLRHVRKLGNPVSVRTPDGRLWLFYVTVSLGGWAGSSITYMTSTDDGMTWSSSSRLITSPFLNISTLVKGTPFLYEDGTIGLPVYHEFIGKFGELLQIGNGGEIIDKQRLSFGQNTLQPVILIKNTQHALALMRHSGVGPKRVMATTTDDGGKSWSSTVSTMLSNPDSAISGLRLNDGSVLVVLNNSETGRDSLSLAISQDEGGSWRTIYQLEDQRGSTIEPEKFAHRASELAKSTDPGIVDATTYGESAKSSKCDAQICRFEFSYPYLLRTQDGDFHVVYTWNRSHIKHVRFSSAWLNNQIRTSVDGELH